MKAAAEMEIAARISAIAVSSTMKVAAEAERMRAEGIDVVDFGAGEPDFPTPDNIKQAAVRALERNFTRYTNAAGTAELRAAVCERHARDYGTSYTPEECVVTVGGKHAVFSLVQALVNPGDEVLIPVPYWVTYKDVVNYSGGRPVFVETDEAEGFRLTAERIARKITPRTRMLIVNSPSNPSGAVLDPDEFLRIYELTAGRGIRILTDECYCRFLYDHEPFSIASAPGARKTVVVAGSLSKTYAMTGWRVGFALAPRPVAAAIVKLQSHSTSNVTSIAQKAAVEALAGPQDAVQAMLAEYRRRRDFVLAKMAAIPDVRCATPQGAFYAYPNIRAALRGDTTVEFAGRLLQEARVAVVPGEAFGTSEHIRISYATSIAELDRGLDRLREFIARRM